MIRELLDMGPATFWFLLISNFISIGVLWFTSRRELLLLERRHRNDIQALRDSYEEELVAARRVS